MQRRKSRQCLQDLSAKTGRVPEKAKPCCRAWLAVAILPPTWDRCFPRGSSRPLGNTPNGGSRNNISACSSSRFCPFSLL
ncbi:MAG: hypothetical protein ACI30J_08795 [Paludibacteraceae bacterium]